MIKLADYVVDFLAERGVADIFMVSGGGIMHLVESVGRHPKVKYICNYHEQSCAVAAEAYARITGHIGACIVTSGPGSTNALSGIVGAWVDSIPLMVISGQVRRDLIADYHQLRQLGPQEINIIDLVRPVTKYAANVMEPEGIRHELELAYAKATTGKPGPVWISIPLDVQAAMLDEAVLSGYQSEGESVERPLSRSVKRVINRLNRAERPVVICGNGIHISKAEQLLDEFVKAMRLPVLMTIGGMDLLDETDEFNMGRFGPLGQRRANFALQNADVVLSLGASMSVASTGFNISGFAPNAEKVMVNIDPGELKKPTYHPDLAIQADVKVFLREALIQLEGIKVPARPRWEAACRNWKRKYPIFVPEYQSNHDYVNTYFFADRLSDLLGSRDVLVTGNSLDIASVYQTFRVKKGQRVITNSNYGAMGWDLPGAVGACVGLGNQRTILYTGDGSFQFNVHELMTIAQNHLNVKVFVINNQGYDSIRATQSNYFAGHFVGADPGSGVGNPDFSLLASAYGLEYDCLLNNDQVQDRLGGLLTWDGPVLCELKVSYDQGRSPKTSSFQKADGTLESRPLEDMYPFLPREEVWENMHLFDPMKHGRKGAAVRHKVI